MKLVHIRLHGQWTDAVIVEQRRFSTSRRILTATAWVLAFILLVLTFRVAANAGGIEASAEQARRSDAPVHAMNIGFNAPELPPAVAAASNKPRRRPRWPYAWCPVCRRPIRIDSPPLDGWHRDSWWPHPHPSSLGTCPRCGRYRDIHPI